MGGRMSEQPAPPMRRLSDKLLAAFKQACEQKDLQVAELLQKALELVLTRSAGPNDSDKRRNIEEVLESYGRLVDLRRASES